MHTLTIRSTEREQFISITSLLAEFVASHGLRDGLLHLHCPHTTAGLTINENADPSVVRDLLTSLRRLVPERGDYTHSEGNSDAHLKSSLMGCTLTLTIENARPILGTWQGVFFCEFDGPRERKLHLMWLPGAGL